MIKYITSNKSGRGFITHDDQEVDGLLFKCYHINGLQYVRVEGDKKAVDVWCERVNGVEIAEDELCEQYNSAEKAGLSGEIVELQNRLNTLT